MTQLCEGVLKKIINLVCYILNGRQHGVNSQQSQNAIKSPCQDIQLTFCTQLLLFQHAAFFKLSTTQTVHSFISKTIYNIKIQNIDVIVNASSDTEQYIKHVLLNFANKRYSVNQSSKKVKIATYIYKVKTKVK